MQPIKPFVERVWRRDGSINVMTLETAAENLKSHSTYPDLRDSSLQEIERLLRYGYILSTGQASFRRSSK